MHPSYSKENLIWIDLEMTGLDTLNDEIIEIATIVTDKDLNILGEGPVMAVHQTEEILITMDEWNQKQHGSSGLLDRVRQSTIGLREAELTTVRFLEQYVPEGISPMCGNSICQDRRFLARSMPQLESFFHYRNLDVSSIKELAKRWAPDIAKQFKKQGAHLALEDIHESIRELAFYRSALFGSAVQLPKSQVSTGISS